MRSLAPMFMKREPLPPGQTKWMYPYHAGPKFWMNEMDERMELKERVGKIQPGDYVYAVFESRKPDMQDHTVAGECYEDTPGYYRIGKECLRVGDWPHSSLKAITVHIPAEREPQIGEPITKSTRLVDKLAVVNDASAIFQYNSLTRRWESADPDYLRLATGQVVNFGYPVVYIPK